MFRSLPLNEIYSVVYIAAAAVYILAGVYVLSLNLKSVLNRTFFFMTLSLGLWAFSYSLGNSSLTIEEALFWNRVSVFGWGLMYTIQLHYFIVLTDRSSLLTKKSSYLILYLPAAINLILFSINPTTAPAQYSLIWTDAGWVDISEIDALNYYFYAYYIVNSALSVLSIWTWSRQKADKKAKMTAYVITVSMVLGLTMGSITDVLLKSTIQYSRPNLGVIFALIPVSSIIYSIGKYGIIKKVDRDNTFIAGELLTAEKRALFFKMLACFFVLGSSIYVVLDYFLIGKEITSVLKFSAVIFILGIHMCLVPYYNISENSQDILIGLALFIVMPALYIHFHQYGYNSVIWSVPFFLMTMSAVFNNRKILILVLISGIAVESVAAVRTEPFTATIGRADYQQRLAIYILLAGLVYYISCLYRKRLTEYENQISLQGEIAKISSEFVSATLDNINEKIDEMLDICSKLCVADRAYLYRFSDVMAEAYYTNEWCDEGINSGLNEFDDLKTKNYPWWMGELKQHRRIYIPDVSELPLEAEAERNLLEMRGVKSQISVPVNSQNGLLGFLGFDAVKNKRTWEPEHQEVLQIMANILSDSLIKVEAEKRINYMAFYDSLTGLPNRTYFRTQLEKMVALAEKKDKLMGIMFLDLDLFKSINDTLGHEAGDKLLVTVAERLSRIVRKSDMVCRFGGDEFLVMLPHMEEHGEIKAASERIMEAFKKPIRVGSQEFYVTASCGIAVYPSDGATAEMLIKNADLAMYESKKAGKNRYTFCTPVMKEEVREKVELANDLYKAMERDELFLYYQPQICVKTNRIVGLEALIRWKHPERGIISPGVFIPIAEQTGLIHSIGEWVLKTACTQNKVWQMKGYDPLVMAVNLSVEQFRGTRLIEVVSESLKESGLDSKYLELEITESIAINEPDYIIEVLRKLKSLGVFISIDDFGTQYSSLSRLKELPIDRLKMAMEFVQGIDKGTKDEAIAVVIINLAKSLGLKVIAEGVEAEEQYKFLKDRVCDEVQGYYFYRPMPAEDIEKIMQKTQG
jgi:diguanylate cyclase (GGDEF)-like protein